MEVSWTDDSVESSRFEELELLLSVDGGRTFPIRVTRDLPVGTDRVLWRVPFLRSRSARLAVRFGESGDPDSEGVRFTSDEFAIEFATGGGLETLYPVAGELRLLEALEDKPRPDLFGRTLARAAEDRISKAPFTAPLAPPRASAMDGPACATTKARVRRRVDGLRVERFADADLRAPLPLRL